MSPDAQSLLQNLQAADANVRQVATAALWRLWYTQKGAYGAQILVRSQNLLDEGQAAKAETILTEAVETMPDFAEA